MKTETLQLAGTIDEAVAMNVARVLDAINGVSRVAIITSTGSVNVDFDDGLTSTRELRAALDQAGFRLKSAHGSAGVCCGGCGG